MFGVMSGLCGLLGGVVEDDKMGGCGFLEVGSWIFDE